MACTHCRYVALCKIRPIISTTVNSMWFAFWFLKFWMSAYPFPVNRIATIYPPTHFICHPSLSTSNCMHMYMNAFSVSSMHWCMILFNILINWIFHVIWNENNWHASIWPIAFALLMYPISNAINSQLNFGLKNWHTHQKMWDYFKIGSISPAQITRIAALAKNKKIRVNSFRANNILCLHWLFMFVLIKK